MLLGKIRNRFGSKKGLLNTVKFKLLFLLGKYKKYHQINFNQVEHLVFICSGNICRSPLAEYTAKSLGISSESFGLHCRGGDFSDDRAIAFAKENSIDMANHITKNINEYVPKSSDLIIAMEPSHILELENLGLADYQITSLAIWSIRNSYLHDPFNSNEQFFDRCESIVILGTKCIIDKLLITSNLESR